MRFRSGSIHNNDIFSSPFKCPFLFYCIEVAASTLPVKNVVGTDITLRQAMVRETFTESDTPSLFLAFGYKRHHPAIPHSASAAGSLNYNF